MNMLLDEHEPSKPSGPRGSKLSPSSARPGHEPGESEAFGKGVYGGADALRLVNFHRDADEAHPRIARQTISRWMRGYDFDLDGETRRMPPLWQADYVTGDDEHLEVSFRDLIELRFVKSFRDVGLGLQTIRTCFERAAAEVRDPRPFSTRKFRTDGKTIFLEITDGLEDAKLLDLKQRQAVFRSFVAPSFKDLEFDADMVARWFPLGSDRRSVVVDPLRAFGRPIVGYGVPTEVVRDAIAVEGSAETVAKLYDLPVTAVRDAAIFEQRLAA